MSTVVGPDVTTVAYVDVPGELLGLSERLDW
jgi:hypothetical protein